MAKRSSKWYQLDNAAKIIPSTVRGANTRVFRISCELKEDADPVILQEALDETIEEFSYFNSVLRKGVFWYYLEHRDNLKATVSPENLPPCSRLYFAGRKNLLYRIIYHRKRISLEMFHVLADGTGGFIFFKKLILNYLCKKYDIDISSEGLDKSSATEKNTDAFRDFYQRGRGLGHLRNLSSRKAFKLRGERDLDKLPHLVEGCMSASAFLKAAHDHKTSVGVLATSLYIASVIDVMNVHDRKRPIVVSVPVNLRQYFHSETTRNFYGTITIVYEVEKEGTELENIIKVVSESFKEQLSQENIAATMNSYSALERNPALKILPLFIKDIGIVGFNAAAKRGVTSTMSNLGNIDLPKECSSYIDRFSCFMPAQSQQICLCSYQDKMVFGEVSPFVTHDVMMHFFRRCVAMGIDVEVTSSDHNADPEVILAFEEERLNKEI
ncbi:hypothetical protein [Butyrivibrio sp. MC2013]|uniref:hypothetical protein n=1 Tax=Butyrivibrio sp. MC2013 TaxID=1280686 RepID=UPI0004159F08|nr:hypothetical protein [Butyrivibrio sp. MC2013]